jgi:hypothetical protein
MIPSNLSAYVVNMTLRILATRCKCLTPLLAAPAALLLIQEQAKAVLTYNIFESAGNVVVQASGSLDLTGATLNGTNYCSADGVLFSRFATICTGPQATQQPVYGITGPGSFAGSALLIPASSVSGLNTLLGGSANVFDIDPTYVFNTPIVSSATFNGTTLATLGFTTTGLIGTWTINGTSESIQVIIGAPTPPGATVPGPLPLFGASAAFGWSRRLRKRITAPLSTPPQA